MSGPSALAPALSLQGVGKEYRLYASPRQRLRAVLTGQALHQSHWALQEVSLTLQRGRVSRISEKGDQSSHLLVELRFGQRTGVGYYDELIARMSVQARDGRRLAWCVAFLDGSCLRAVKPLTAL